MNEQPSASLGKPTAQCEGAESNSDEHGNEHDNEQSEVSLDDLGQAFAQLLGGDAPQGDIASDADVHAMPNDEETDASCSPTNETGAGSQPLNTEESESSSNADDEACVISPTTILEAVLFVGHPDNTPLSSKEIAAVMRGVEPGEIERLVNELNQNYEQLKTPYYISSATGGYRMALRDEYATVRERFYSRVKEVRLSQPAIDVLAVVAYNQPVTRQEIDEIRGRAAGAVLTHLVQRGLLRMERGEEKPRTPQYRTTQRFLEVFRLESLNDLPHSEELTG